MGASDDLINRSLFNGLRALRGFGGQSGNQLRNSARSHRNGLEVQGIWWVDVRAQASSPQTAA